MVRKGYTTSVYVNRDQVERLRDLGLDLSGVTNKALEIIDSDEFADVAVEMRLKINEDLIGSTREEILRLETRLVHLRQRLTTAVERQTEIKTEWEITKRTVILSRYMYQLNLAIIAANYDTVTISESAKQIIEKIVEINPQFQLDAHVTGFRKEMSR